MKIVAIRTFPADIPLARPIKAGGWQIASIGVLAVTAETDTGITGEGLAFTLNGRRMKMLVDGVESLAPLAIGLDPCFSGQFMERALADTLFFGHKSPLVMSMAAIETALWDARAKAAGLPMHRLIGAVRDRVPVYWSGGLWLTQSIDALQREAAERVAAGYRAMKIRVARGDDAVTAERVAAVRAAVGPSIKLMVDANQTLDVTGAIALARRLAPFDLTWFEEPIPYYDHKGEAAIAAASPIPIASGESEYLSRGLAEMVALGSAQTLMPDLQRMGGIGEFLKAAHIAEPHGVAISSHLFSEMSLGVLAALPNATFLEVMPWLEDVYQDRIEIVDGHARVSERPGHGYRLDFKALERYRM
ncbi:MAG: mandelate racemase/muconate lactonizing enzyme family protein [Hyphomicrobiaceae bacterium]